MKEPLRCPCGPIISSVQPFDILYLSKFYDQYSSDDIFSQGDLIVLSALCNIGSFKSN